MTHGGIPDPAPMPREELLGYLAGGWPGLPETLRNFRHRDPLGVSIIERLFAEALRALKEDEALAYERAFVHFVGVATEMPYLRASAVGRELVASLEEKGEPKLANDARYVTRALSTARTNASVLHRDNMRLRGEPE